MVVRICLGFFVIVFLIQTAFGQTRRIDSLKLEIGKHAEDSSKVKSLIELAITYLYKNNDTAFYYANKANTLAKRINWKKGIVNSGYRIGWLNLSVGNYDTALAWYNRALPVSKEMELSGDKTSSCEGKKGQVTLYGAIGDVLSYKSDYSKAIKNFFIALKFAEEIKDLNEIARQNRNIGNVHLAEGNYNKALNFFTKSLKLREETGNKRGIATSLESIGSVYYGLDQYENALMFRFRALEILNKLEDQAGIVACYINISNTYFELADYKKACSYSQKALDISTKTGNKHFASKSMSSLGNALTRLKKFKEAEKYFKNALTISDSLGTLEFSAKIHLALSDLYRNTNKADKVFEHYKMYTVLRDTIYSEENKKAQMQAEVNYEFEKKESALKMEQEKRTAVFEAENRQQKRIMWISIASFIVLLLLSLLLLRNYNQKQETNKMLAAQKLELEKANIEKDSLLKEIHHRVKNNLQVISGLLSLQNSEHQSEELKAILKEGQSRVKSMALIHQMLYQNQNLNTIPFQNYLEELSKLIEKTFGTVSKKIQISVDADSISLDVDTAIPLGLIINELLSNSIKYAFDSKENGGQINISMNKLTHNQYSLTIKDNGKGIPDSFNFETSKSLGLRLVKMLCTQMRAEFNMIVSNGTQIEIKFSDTWKS